MPQNRVSPRMAANGRAILIMPQGFVHQLDPLRHCTHAPHHQFHAQGALQLGEARG
jgi:hypothetical protein